MIFNKIRGKEGGIEKRGNRNRRRKGEKKVKQGQNKTKDEKKNNKINNKIILFQFRVRFIYTSNN
jgi:hypothetical protein